MHLASTTITMSLSGPSGLDREARFIDSTAAARLDTEFNPSMPSMPSKVFIREPIARGAHRRVSPTVNGRIEDPFGREAILGSEPV